MNHNNLYSPEKLQETFRIMLMTLEYGGSVNNKVLNDLEEQIKKSSDQVQSTVTS